MSNDISMTGRSWAAVVIVRAQLRLSLEADLAKPKTF